MSTQLNQLSEIAKQNPANKFTSLAHLLDETCLTQSYYELNRYAAEGIDQVTYEEYGRDLYENIKTLVMRLKSKRYEATEIRRVRIPKPDGGERPLGILILEDKIVQRGVAKILSAIYEEDFLENSYGFRNKRNGHDALKAVELSIIKGRVNYLLDVDIRGYFDHIDHSWLRKMMRIRIIDRTILQLIGKWLKAGIVEKGKRISNVVGVPQGGVISPLLSNIYLHYVLDRWIKNTVGRELTGRVYLIRYADDFVIGCTNRKDAERVWELLQDRLNKFGLEIAKEKSRLIEFGERAYSKQLGKKLNTFDFLGFTHYMTRSRKGGVKLGRKTIGKRMRRKLKEINEKLKVLRNAVTYPELYEYLCRVLTGYYNYFGFAGNYDTLAKFDYAVRRIWFKTLNRRRQQRSITWDKLLIMLKRLPLPKPRILKGYKWIYAAV